MKGSVRKRGKKWYYYFDLGIVDGKRKRVERVGGDTKKEAEKALREALSEFDDTGTYVDESDMTFNDYLDYWYENYVELNCKTTTKQKYRLVIDKHIKPTLGGYKLNALNSALLQDFCNTKYKDGYSKSSLSQYVSVIYNSLKYAVNPMQLLKYNPCVNVKIPKYNDTAEHEVKTISKDQFNILLEKFPKGRLLNMPLLIGYHTGMRIGEICALTWDDIDLTKKTINVNKTLVYNLRNGFSFGTTKTKTSNRTILIGDTLVKILKEHKILQKENKLKYGEFYLDKDYPAKGMVCTSESGNYTTPKSTSSIIGKIAKKELGFEFTFHMLRHTHATMLIQSGVNIKEVQKRLGHAKISITLDTYGHSTKESQKIAVDTFENYING
ncbi:tyrosine-type recombinase/integrase [Metaclostridioides mangenotii]|uniref:Integrase n=1 Tax=Metaclostridioides mangenotii TaxID=1540 RepID=A0ABS4E9R5_9FIRM|nr:tyrosine-type recombinase/integrase [Clostridioides mangenotii]MBP1854695.1 integrase [Clostridioides mangenotii]